MNLDTKDLLTSVVGVFRTERVDSSSSVFRVVWISQQLDSFFTSG